MTRDIPHKRANHQCFLQEQTRHYLRVLLSEVTGLTLRNRIGPGLVDGRILAMSVVEEVGAPSAPGTEGSSRMHRRNTIILIALRS